MLNNFITGLMRSVGVVMFFAGAALLAYGVVGGYYHWTIWYYAIATGFAGWVLFFSGMNLVQQYKVADQPAFAPQPQPQMPLPSNPYGGSATPASATAANVAQNFPGGGKSASLLDNQKLDD